MSKSSEDNSSRGNINSAINEAQDRALSGKGDLTLDEISTITDIHANAVALSRAFTRLEEYRIRGETPPQELVQEYERLSAKKEGSTPDGEEVDLKLEDLGLRPFSLPAGKELVFDSSHKLDLEKVFTVQDLQPGEGGYTALWLVEDKNAPLMPTSGGTFNIPIGKNLDSDVIWDKERVAELLKENT